MRIRRSGLLVDANFVVARVKLNAHGDSDYARIRKNGFDEIISLLMLLLPSN
jgi:hypothetical protein